MRFESPNGIKMLLPLGLCPGPLWGNLQSTLDPLTQLAGFGEKEEGNGMREKNVKKRQGRKEIKKEKGLKSAQARLKNLSLKKRF